MKKIILIVLAALLSSCATMPEDQKRMLWIAAGVMVAGYALSDSDDSVTFTPAPGQGCRIVQTASGPLCVFPASESQ